ncbi:MAG: PEP-CTERM sorting domain-containing protein [Massilia sp.]
MNFASMIARCAASALLGLGISFAATAAPTTLSYALTDNVSGLGTGPYGTITLTQFTNYVSFTVTPDSGFAFANTGGPHYEFAFNTSSAFDNAAVTVTGSAANYFSVVSGSGLTAAAYGSFDHAIDFKSNVGGGLSGKMTAPLTFNVSKAGITLNDFVANTNGVYFVADLGNLGSGKTGNAISNGTLLATRGDTSDQTGSANGKVPEPAPLALIALALFGMAAVRRKA